MRRERSVNPGSVVDFVPANRGSFMDFISVEMKVTSFHRDVEIFLVTFTRCLLVAISITWMFKGSYRGNLLYY